MKLDIKTAIGTGSPELIQAAVKEVFKIKIPIAALELFSALPDAFLVSRMGRNDAVVLVKRDSQATRSSADLPSDIDSILYYTDGGRARARVMYSGSKDEANKICNS